MPAPLKPPALLPGSKISVIAPASASEGEPLNLGRLELVRLGYDPQLRSGASAEGYFAGSTEARSEELLAALRTEAIRAAFCVRGGYGSNYLLENLQAALPTQPKILMGYSDITSLEVFLWQKLGWVTFYGPMVASGFDAGAGKPQGYDLESFTRAMTETSADWSLDLRAEPMIAGTAEGVLLGGCLTLVETTLGTPWELDTRGTILLLEDRGMRPYQVDRALMHLKHAGKLQGVRGILLGDFPDCEPATPGPKVRDVCRRILGELGVPIIWGAPVGHTPRPKLTVPLGVRGRLRAGGAGQLEILEPAVVP